jgi:hypothetical protein
MALYSINTLTTTDLTAKGKRLASVVASSVAGGVVSINDGTGGTTRYKFNLGANSQAVAAFPAPTLPVFVNGMSVVTSGTDVVVTLDIQ